MGVLVEERNSSNPEKYKQIVRGVRIDSSSIRDRSSVFEVKNFRAPKKVSDIDSRDLTVSVPFINESQRVIYLNCRHEFKMGISPSGRFYREEPRPNLFETEEMKVKEEIDCIPNN